VYRHIVYSMNHCRDKISGAKLFQSHLEKCGASLSGVKKHIPNARFIILYRKSLLDQFLSYKIAQVTSHYSYKHDFKLPPFVHIVHSELYAFCEAMKGLYTRIFEHAWLKDCSVVISYEELVVAPQKIFDDLIFPFLGLDSVPVTTTMKKQNTKSLEEIIVNYAELEPLLSEPWLRLEYPPQTVSKINMLPAQINFFASTGKIS